MIQRIHSCTETICNKQQLLYEIINKYLQGFTILAFRVTLPTTQSASPVSACISSNALLSLSWTIQKYAVSLTFQCPIIMESSPHLRCSSALLLLRSLGWNCPFIRFTSMCAYGLQSLSKESYYCRSLSSLNGIHVLSVLRQKLLGNCCKTSIFCISKILS